MSSRVTLLTDFGTADGYVAVMKGVVAARVWGVLLDDVAHDLPQGDVRAASRALGRYWRLFPEGTVHLVVVDPGVGTERRALALECAARYVVAPDNGVVSAVLDAGKAWRAVQVTSVEAPVDRASQTFHGRDVFAPAAAHLAAGSPLEALGPALEDPVRLARSRAVRGDDGVARGHVISVDRFGNLGTDLPGDWLHKGSRVAVEGRQVEVTGTYAEGPPEEPVALVNSDGVVEIAVRDGSAAALLSLGVGAEVTLEG